MLLTIKIFDITKIIQIKIQNFPHNDFFPYIKIIDQIFFSRILDD